MFNNRKLEEIYNQYRENKLSHAYLIETNDISLALEDLKTLAKILNCTNEYNSNCTKCNLCNLISKQNLPSLKIIEPDGASIKKNQIEELKNSFGTKPIYSKYNIYIIKQASKLNSSSANAMLKFLEEPENGIIGFFLTDNKDTMMATIKSRCQSLTLNYDSINILNLLNITAEEYKLYEMLIKEFLTEINQNANINNKELILSKINERQKIETMFKIIFQIYYQAFLKSQNKTYDENIFAIFPIKDNFDIIIKKLNIISQFLNDLNYNVNLELILDKFVIEMRK